MHRSKVRWNKTENNHATTKRKTRFFCELRNTDKYSSAEYTYNRVALATQRYRPSQNFTSNIRKFSTQNEQDGQKPPHTRVQPLHYILWTTQNKHKNRVHARSLCTHVSCIQTDAPNPPKTNNLDTECLSHTMFQHMCHHPLKFLLPSPARTAVVYLPCD